MQNVKLRLDYFLSLGLKLTKKDTYTLRGRVYVISSAEEARIMSIADKDNCIRFITAFAPRKNTGVQPCGDDVPVVCDLLSGNQYKKSAAECLWELEAINGDILSWKPDIDKLIKMQIEHDIKLALTAECEKITATATPKQGDKRRIEFMSNHTGQLEIHAVTYQFETDKEICCIAEDDGIVLIVDKEEFVAWHDAVDEMEEAKKKQIDFILDVSVSAGYHVNKHYIQFIQNNNMLAEITLPLKN